VTGVGDMKKFAGLVLLVIVSSCVYAGPFGLEMGWKLSDLDAAGIQYEETSRSGDIIKYKVNPAKPHSSFTTYVVGIDKIEGIYDITAITDVINDSDLGTKTKELYAKIRDQLALSYGKQEEFDFLQYGSIWKDVDDWMFGLYKGDRILMSYWQLKRSDLDVVVFEAVGISSTSSLLRLGYQSPKAGEVIDRMHAKEASVF